MNTLRAVPKHREEEMRGKERGRHEKVVLRGDKSRRKNTKERMKDEREVRGVKLGERRGRRGLIEEGKLGGLQRKAAD